MRRFFLRFSYLCLVLLAAAGSPAFAQVGTPESPLLFSAQTSRGDYWVGEPVVIRAALHNWFFPDLTLYTSFGFQGLTDVRIFRDGEEGPRYTAHFGAAPQTIKTILMPYGKRCEYRLVMEYDPVRPSRLVFEQPGLYPVQLVQAYEYNTPYLKGGSRRSAGVARISVKVDEPPEFARPALDLIKSDPEAIMDLNRLMASPPTEALLRQVAEKYPDSRYAPFCLHAVGSLALTLSTALPDERKKAEEAYTSILKNYPDYPLRDEVKLHLGKLYLLSDRTDDADAMARELLAESPDNLYRFRDAEIIRPYRGTPANPNIAMNIQNWELFDTANILPDAYAQIRFEEIN